ncbi:hypothetical protein CQJ94_11385 [Glycomyces fuscus]|nr:hypothetical protein CQJ94_11385 [Glycomyces fuscus]
MNVRGSISTDDIIPARYKHMYTEPDELAPHVFEHRFPGMAGEFRQGDALVSDSITGIGSSREQAVSALLGCGVTVVIAPKFGRIFYRNCWNLGLPALEMDTRELGGAEEIGVSLESGVVSTGSVELAFHPVPQLMIDMVRSGGMLSLVLAGGNPATAARKGTRA